MRAKGMIPSKAAIAAGFASGSAVYTELEGNPEVVVRVRELMDELEERKQAKSEANREAARVVGQVTGYGKAWVLEKLAENASLAQSDADYKEANVALRLIGEELGMFKGASAADEESSAGQTLDLDKFAALMEGAPLTGLSPPPERTVDIDTALGLIEGQGSAARRLRREREAFSDSEANVALTPDSDPDSDMPPNEESDDDEQDAA
jgi:hypothetical protein